MKPSHATNWNNYDSLVGRIRLETIELRSGFDLLKKTESTRKNPEVGLHKKIIDNRGNESNVPVDEVRMISFQIDEKINKISDYVDKFEVVIYTLDNYGDSKIGTDELVLASGLFGENEAHGYQIPLTDVNIKEFIESHNTYLFELRAYFHTVPTEITAISFIIIGYILFN